MHEEQEQESQERICSRPSVAQLAGRFAGSSPPSAGETEKPVRRRPPRTLQLPKCHGDEREEAAGVTSPVKVKRNSALIEKLQANLALSPAALLPSPGSPGVRPPPFSPPPSPGPVAASPSSALSSPALTEEEGPASFEAPPTATEGALLVNVNKSRARHSLRRRPPSRRHRKSSGGEDVGVASEDADTRAGRPEPKSRQEAGGDVLGDPNPSLLEKDKSDPSPEEERANDEQDERRVDKEEKESGDGVGVEAEKQEKTLAEDQNNNREALRADAAETQ
ncbi:duboraya [Stigmatopora argus]